MKKVENREDCQDLAVEDSRRRGAKTVEWTKNLPNPGIPPPNTDRRAPNGHQLYIYRYNLAVPYGWSEGGLLLSNLWRTSAAGIQFLYCDHRIVNFPQIDWLLQMNFDINVCSFFIAYTTTTLDFLGALWSICIFELVFILYLNYRFWGCSHSAQEIKIQHIGYYQNIASVKLVAHKRNETSK